jgi:hypothetical protein
MFSRNLTNTDMLYHNDIVYLSNGLHDYMLNNFFTAFSMGVLLGVIIGLNAYLFTAFIKDAFKNKG